MGGMIKSLIAGSIGGAIGAVIWAAIVYFAHAEVGYVAWGIGILVGICVKAAAEEIDEGVAGVIAAILSVGAILAGKLLGAIFLANWLINEGKAPGGADMYWSLVGLAFQASFGVMDVVFFILAVITAYKLGSGNEDD